MKKLLFLFVLFLAHPAFAQQVVLPCSQTSTAPCAVASSTNPLPIAVYDSGNHSGYCYTSNGSASAATFQVCGGGGGTVTLGTSASVANPQISGDATSGFYTPGAAQVSATVSGIQVMQWDTLASGVDYLKVTAGTSTSPPSIAVAGTTTNQSLNLTPAGTGSVNVIGSGSSAFTVGSNSTTPAFIVNDSVANGVNSGIAIIGGHNGAAIPTLQTQSSQGDSFSLSMNIYAANGTAGGVQAGTITVLPGTGVVDGGGGDLVLKGGGGGTNPASQAGSVKISGGTPNTGKGGNITLTGAAGGNGPGGSISITAGNAGGSNQNGGTVTMLVGTATGTGTAGFVGIGTTTYGSSVLTVSGLTTGTNADFLCLNSTGGVLIQSSSCTISQTKLKENISSLDEISAVTDLMKLRPVKFKMKDDGNRDPNYTHPQYGFLAEEVAAVDPRLSIYEDDMQTPKSWRQDSVISALVKGFQAQQAEISGITFPIHKCFFGLLVCAN